MLQLIEPLELDGTLVPRGRAAIEREVETFSVLAHDGIIYGCVAVIPYLAEEMVEMACLVVHPEWQNSGEGDLLLRHAEQRARALRAKKLFVLTTRTSHRSEEHTSELQSRGHLVCRLLLEKKK